MRVPRAKIVVEWPEITKKDLMVVVVITAIGFVCAEGLVQGFIHLQI